MSYKTILVHVAPDEGDAPRIKVAAELARWFHAELVAVGALDFDPYRDLRLTHLDAFEIGPIREGIEAGLKRAEVQLRHVAGSLPVRWRTALQDPDDLLVRQANCADLIVATRPHGRRDLRSFAEVDDLIIESGLPVLVLPPEQAELNARRIVVGWKNTPEARRALAGALPFLVGAEAVTIVAAGLASEQEAVEAEMADVVARLRGHGVMAEQAFHAVTVTSAAETLLEYATAQKADMIVVGGFGHSRMRQWVLGGVTSDLLALAWKPVLFVH